MPPQLLPRGRSGLVVSGGLRGVLSGGDQGPTLYEADKISGMYWNGSRSRSKRLYLLLNNIVIIVEDFKYTREIYCPGVWIADVAQPVRCRYNANEGRR